MDIQFIKYPDKDAYFALYAPRIGERDGRMGGSYDALIALVKGDIAGIPPESIGYAFNSHWPLELRVRTVEALGLEDRLPRADVLQFRKR